MDHLHRDYYRRTDIVDAVFKEFLNKIYRGLYAKMSKKDGAPPATLKRSYKKFKSNPSWRPYDPANYGIIIGTLLMKKNIQSQNLSDKLLSIKVCFLQMQIFEY